MDKKHSCSCMSGVLLQLDAKPPDVDVHDLVVAVKVLAPDALQELFIEEFGIGNYLNVIDCGAVVEGDEFDLLVSSLCAYPAFGKYIGTGLHGQEGLNLCPFYLFHCD